MKILWPTLVLAGFSVAFGEQTSPTAPAAKPAERPPTQITSDSVDFDLKTRMAIYRGHVRVDDPTMSLTCEILTAKVPESGGNFDSIIAERNVVIDATDAKGQTNRATGDRVIYTHKVEGSVTNEVVELTGNPRLEAPQGALTGDMIVWDKANNRVRATNQKMIINTGGTNQFPARFDKPTDAKK
jgi:lipopolysaccharide transport protein LptA